MGLLLKCRDCETVPDKPRNHCDVCFCDTVKVTRCLFCRTIADNWTVCQRCGSRDLFTQEENMSTATESMEPRTATRPPRKRARKPDDGAEPKPRKKRSRKKSSSRAQSNGDTSELTLRVSFGNVSIGADTARVGAKVTRDKINPKAADEHLCGRRLNCILKAQPAGDDPDQTYMLEDMKIQIEAVCDVKRLGFGQKDVSFGLSMALAEISVEKLAKFAKQEGFLVIESSRSLDEIVDEE